MGAVKSASLNATWIDVTVKTTETTIAHNLSRTPVEAFVLRLTSGGKIYRSTTTWDGTNIYLKADVKVLARILIF